MKKLDCPEFSVLARKSSGLWSDKDMKVKSDFERRVEEEMPELLRGTAFEFYFTSFCRTVCSPDVFFCHHRMGNDNGKHLIENVIGASLGTCKALSLIYKRVYRCGNHYFRVHHTTHSKDQPQSDQKTCSKMRHVIAMVFETDDITNAKVWMYEESYLTPKVIIADADSSTEPKKIQDKEHALLAQMKAYQVDDRPLLGLIVGNNLSLKAYSVSSQLVPFYPLHGQDLSDLVAVLIVIQCINEYLHQSSDHGCIYSQESTCDQIQI